MQINTNNYTKFTFSSKRTFRKNFDTCFYSGEKFKLHEKKTIEHIIPMSQGGKNDYTNYFLVKREWNQKRSSIPLNEFIKQNPQVKNNIISCVNAHEGEIIEGIDWAGEIKKTLYKAIGYDIFEAK